MSGKLAARIESVAYHRNGISGRGFYLVAFRYRQGRKLRPMAGVVFPSGWNDDLGIPEFAGADGYTVAYTGVECAVISLDKPQEHWRGDTFADELTRAVLIYEEKRGKELAETGRVSA